MSDPTAPAAPSPYPSGSVLPVVPRARRGLPSWALVAIVAALGLMLFVILNARRQALSAPAIRPRAVDMQPVASSPPPLYIPQEPAYLFRPAPVPPPAPVAVFPAPARPAQAPAMPAPSFTPPAQTAPSQYAQPAAAPARVASGPALVIDTTSGDSGARPGAPAAGPGAGAATAQRGTAAASVAGERAGAGVFANKSTTVPQGTLIPAVLETALDSTSTGLARAIVSHDIRGFDGTRVLIPRGSRLIGEYGADAAAGQSRMLVNWIRLIRPDGGTIAIGSPAADTLGRGGIKASVNSHFFERFAGAILQSALNVGVNLASRSANSQYVVALPGSFNNAVSSAVPSSNDVKPTLKVKAATSISVFVARDLDFTGVEAP